MITRAGGRLAFLSTLSLRRATKRVIGRNALHELFLSTLSLRRATIISIASSSVRFISIHALLAESDYTAAATPQRRRHFYPRSPCGERPLQTEIGSARGIFLSTLSLRRATTVKQGPGLCGRYFYPRSPCGERHTLLVLVRLSYNFYPRSPCGERRSDGAVVRPVRHFYPRSPCGERRTGRRRSCPAKNFYPRSPCGERPTAPICLTALPEFLSTLSLRRATDPTVTSYGEV